MSMQSRLRSYLGKLGGGEMMSKARRGLWVPRVADMVMGCVCEEVCLEVLK